MDTVIIKIINSMDNLHIGGQEFHDYQVIPNHFLNSLAIKCLIEESRRTGHVDRVTFSDDQIKVLLESCHSIYLDIQHLFFVEKDCSRIVEQHWRTPNPTFLYTEFWRPILKRFYIQDMKPQEINYDHQIIQNLEMAKLFHDRCLQLLDSRNPGFGKISKALRLRHAFTFYFPWPDYFNTHQDYSRIEALVRIIDNLPPERRVKKDKLRNIMGNDWNLANEMLISTRLGSASFFPLIHEFGDEYVIPRDFLLVARSFIDLFASQTNRTLSREYEGTRGKVVEEMIFTDLSSYKLDFSIPNDPSRILVSYTLPSSKTDIDVGAFHRGTKSFFLIECKGKHNISHENYDAQKLLKNINDDFIHFRDVSIPAVHAYLTSVGRDDYTLIPIFFNLVPLDGEISNLDFREQKDGIIVVQSNVEISAAILVKIQHVAQSFHDLYNIPQDFLLMRTQLAPIPLSLLTEGIDLGIKLGKEPQRYLILSVKIVKVDFSEKGFPELWVKVNDGSGQGLFLDILPEAEDELKSLGLKEGENAGVFVYRHHPHAQALILGRCWRI